jgi:hypothetical protein
MERHVSKKEVQAEATRKKILLAATRLFARQGYHKTTIADIAQAIQSSPRGPFFIISPPKRHCSKRWFAGWPVG